MKNWRSRHYAFGDWVEFEIGGANVGGRRRARMAAHREQCPVCRQHSDEAVLWITAARVEPLPAPSLWPGIARQLAQASGNPAGREAPKLSTAPVRALWPRLALAGAVAALLVLLLFRSDRDPRRGEGSSPGPLASRGMHSASRDAEITGSGFLFLDDTSEEDLLSWSELTAGRPRSQLESDDLDRAEFEWEGWMAELEMDDDGWESLAEELTAEEIRVLEQQWINRMGKSL